MTGKTHKQLLVGYLFIALVGIALYKVYGDRIWALLPAMVAGAQPFSWALLPGMGVFMVLFSLTVFFSIPANPLFYLAAGYLYGALPGTLLAVLATALGSGFACLFFRRTITVSPSFKRVEVDNLFLMLVLLRCSPWFPSPLINLFCGTIRVRPSIFAASTLLGSVPLVVVYTLTASRLHGPLEVSLLRSPEIIAALSVLGAVSLLGFLKPLRIVANHLRALAVTRSPAPKGSAVV
jgi:uncharacterized membrane protein YdjX (TVP38/TMEM64 family)